VTRRYCAFDLVILYVIFSVLYGLINDQEGAPHVDAGVWELIQEKGLPVLGICYGMQEMAHSLGGHVAPGQKREYGKAMVHRHEVCPHRMEDLMLQKTSK